MLVGGLISALWLAVEVGRQLPAADEIGTLGIMANATVIFDAFDQPAFTLFRERRLSIPLHEISSHLTGAVLAVEDRRFYDHRGFDLIRMAGAAVIDVQAGRLAQGGSTITQQLARVSLLSRERTFRRKIAEIITAVQIERAYPKDRILEFYLNKVYFGEGFYGVEAAAQGYFGKPASDLTLAEAALLVGLIRAPNVYSPADHPDAALTRRDVVLTAMLHTGAANGEAVSRAKQERVRLRNGLEPRPEFGSYFKAEVRRRLVDRFGVDAVYGEGLRVYTTLVPDLQRAAEDATAAGLHRIEALPRFAPADHEADSRLQAALIAIDPRTGAVRAVVGGRRFTESAFNRATQARRQPGSAFKPFLYAAALDTGLTPATWLADLNRPLPTPEGGWLPDDEVNVTAMTMRTALRLSSNRAAVRLLELTGMDRTLDYAARVRTGTTTGRPLGGAGLRNSDAGAPDSRLRGVCQSGRRAPARIYPAGGAGGRHHHLQRDWCPHVICASRGRTDHRVSRREPAAGCGRRRHRHPGPTRGVRRTGWREDWHDRRLQGRLVRGVHTGTRRGRVDRIRPAAHDHH